MLRSTCTSASLTGLLLLSVFPADGQHQGHDLGSVRFPASCVPAAQKTFERGVALLHSFSYDEAEKTFSEATRIDPGCAMAYWGVAMSPYHPVWAPPKPEDLKKGMAAVGKARSAAAKTQRERDYIAAIEAFYKTRIRCPTGSVPLPGVTPCNSFRCVIRKTARLRFSMLWH